MKKYMKCAMVAAATVATVSFSAGYAQGEKSDKKPGIFGQAAEKIKGAAQDFGIVRMTPKEKLSLVEKLDFAVSSAWAKARGHFDIQTTKAKHALNRLMEGEEEVSQAAPLSDELIIRSVEENVGQEAADNLRKISAKVFKDNRYLTAELQRGAELETKKHEARERLEAEYRRVHYENRSGRLSKDHEIAIKHVFK